MFGLFAWVCLAENYCSVNLSHKKDEAESEGTLRTYDFEWGQLEGQGLGHRGQLPSPCHPSGTAHGE